MKTLTDLDIIESPIEPSDKEEDWIYRIVFNPSDRVKNAEEITVSFHKDYIQINLEYYTASKGTSYEEIFEEWARPKFNEFISR